MFYLSFISLIIAIAAVIKAPARFRIPAVIGGIIASILFFAAGSCASISPTQIGIVYRMGGPEMAPGRLIATNGEKGYQAETLGQGLHYFVNIPLRQKVIPIAVTSIPTGSVGVLTAMDGIPLPEGQTFAPEWADQNMLDAQWFLTHGGFKGPQLTTLPPGNYRVNEALFKCDVMPAINVEAGQVAVVKDKGGSVTAKTETFVNGNPIVENGHRGIWSKALTSGIYYFNPIAREPIYVATTEMSYTYQNGVDDKGQAYHEAIGVRTKDGFQADIDVRINAVVTPELAPLLVATIGEPGKVEFSQQEQEKLSRIEAIIILPEVRSVIRNLAETIEALALVNDRSGFETRANEQIRRVLTAKNIKFNAALIGNIDLTKTEAGKILLETQTDRRVAAEQQQTYTAKQQAEDKRKTLVRAKTEADQEADLAKAEKAIAVNTQQALADLQKAEGEAKVLIALAKGQVESYKLQAETLGADNVAKLEMIKLAGANNVVLTPQVVSGAGTTLLFSTGPSPAK